MAPRGRPKKLSPVKKALNEMAVYGFSEKIILGTIRELLKAYGEDGWPFIEDASYKVLIEAILEKIEKETKEQGDFSQGNSRDQQNAEPSAAIPPVDDSGTVGPQVNQTNVASENNEKLNNLPEANVVLSSPLQTKSPEHNVFPRPASGSPLPADGPGHAIAAFYLLRVVDESPCPTLEESQAEECKSRDMNMTEDWLRRPTDSVDFQTAEQPHSKTNFPLHGIQSPDQAKAHPNQRRGPYFGWISTEDKEDILELTSTDIPELTPASFQELATLLSGNAKEKHKRKWDMKPEDMQNTVV